MEIKEGSLTFVFDERTKAVKFDETDFYRKFFSHQPAGKGVDIIANNENYTLLIEIKNCLGHESDNKWRTRTNRREGDGEDSFDIEIAKKVSSTISCLYGAWTKQMGCSAAKELEPQYLAALHQFIPTDKKKLFIILFLEGNFESDSRSKKLTMKRISESIEQKLHWLNCKVQVVDSNTYGKKHFEVISDSPS